MASGGCGRCTMRDGRAPRRPLLGLGRPQHADDRCTDRGRQVAGPGVVGHQQRGAPQQRAVGARASRLRAQRTPGVVLAQQRFPRRARGKRPPVGRWPRGRERMSGSCGHVLSSFSNVPPANGQITTKPGADAVLHAAARRPVRHRPPRVCSRSIRGGGCSMRRKTAGQLPVADQCMAAVGDGFAAREQKAARLLRVAHRTQSRPDASRAHWRTRWATRSRCRARSKHRVYRCAPRAAESRNCATRWRAGGRRVRGLASPRRPAALAPSLCRPVAIGSRATPAACSAGTPRITSPTQLRRRTINGRESCDRLRR